MEQMNLDLEPNWSNRIVPISIQQDGVSTVITYSNGTKIWQAEGQYHRVNGPAIVKPDGERRYFLEGQECPEYVKSDEDLMIYLIHR